MKKRYLVSAVFVVVALAIFSLASVALAGANTRTFEVDLHELNESGVSGTAKLTVEGGELTVNIHASGLEAGEVHAQHIHGFTDRVGNSTCPTMAADADGDGLVSVGEGLPNYGPVLLPLTPFSTAPGGVIENFEKTYSGGELNPLGNLNTLQNRTIVIHGLTVGDAYNRSLPVACGQIRPAAQGPK